MIEKKIIPGSEGALNFIKLNNHLIAWLPPFLEEIDEFYPFNVTGLHDIYYHPETDGNVDLTQTLTLPTGMYMVRNRNFGSGVIFAEISGRNKTNFKGLTGEINKRVGLLNKGVVEFVGMTKIKKRLFFLDPQIIRL